MFVCLFVDNVPLDVSVNLSYTKLGRTVINLVVI